MTGCIAVLWDDEVDWEAGPFTDQQLSNTYAVFGQLAAEHGATVCVGRFDWYADGRLKKAYQWTDDGWEQVRDVAVAAVFDKYRWDEETVPLKQEIEQRHPVINRFELEKVCKDKLLTYETFPDHVPETREADLETVTRFIEKDGRAVVKPRFAFGGKDVAVLDDPDAFEPGEGLLVQRFIDTTTGIPGTDITGVHDLRLYVLNGETTLAYVRTPESGFISNVHLGGSITFLPLKDVPAAAFDLVAAVAEAFNQYNPGLYSVDIAFDEAGDPWIIECNSKPGLAFYDDPEIEDWKRPVMEQLVNELVALLQN